MSKTAQHYHKRAARFAIASVITFFAVLIVGLSPASADDLTAKRLYSLDDLIEVEIKLPEADWDKLRRQTRDFRSAFSGLDAPDPFTYFKAEVSIDGVKVENVGVRKKGFFGSLDDDFPSLKVKFNEYIEQTPIEGIDVLTLNNNKQDTSLVSQLLAYRLFNAAGVFAPRSNFARVTVNGEYLGIYSNVESIGKPFLRARYGDDSGKLYEGALADFYPQAVERIEAKNKPSKDRAKLMRLAELLADEKELPLEEIEQLVELDNFLRFWAMESLIGFWDGYSNNQNNFWMYENPANGKFYFTPWGADATLMTPQGPFGFNRRGPTSIYAESMLANRLYRTPGVADRYRQTMQAILKDVWKEDELLQTIDDAQSLLAEHLHPRQRGAPQAMDTVRQFIRTRREAIEKEFETWPVRVAETPRKPTYVVDLGSAKGKFAATWGDSPAAKPLEVGRASIELVLEGEKITFKQLGVAAHPAPMPPFGFGFGPPGVGRGGPAGRPPAGPREVAPGRRGPRRAGFTASPQPVVVVFTGRRNPDGSLVTLTLSIDRAAFQGTDGKKIAVQGSLAQGQNDGNSFVQFGGPIVDGELSLAKAGTKVGDAVVGEFDLRIVESRGGFMDRRGR